MHKPACKAGKGLIRMTRKINFALFVMFITVFFSCGGGGGGSSSSKNITAFSFTQGTGVITQGDTAGTIAVTVPYGTALTALVATFTTTGSSVTVDGVTQVSGTTPNDFTNSVTYTVVASDSSTKKYVVTVIVADPSSDATLKLSSVIKGITLDSLGVPGVNIDVFGEPGTTSQMGRVILSLTQASDTGSLETLFVPTNSGATVEKVVKAAQGMMPVLSNPAYADEAFSYDESIAVKVVAQDGVTTLVYWFAVEIEYEIGEVGPAGGLVFYVDMNGIPAFLPDNFFRYLEVSPNDLQTLGDTTWGCGGTEIGVTAQGTGIGAGQTNTTAIVNGCAELGTAAKLCDSLEITRAGWIYNDWYLPSKDELNEIYTSLYLHVPPLGGFTIGDSYWSSSEESSSDAYNQSFGGGSQGSEDKDYNQSFVRAVRAFY